jgi:nucleotide-binding universal stress UspA family protein
MGATITDAAAARARSRHPDLPVTSAVVMEDAAEALLHASQGAAVVVMGARGLGRVAGTLLGSVSQKVTAHARRPVVVVRGPAPPGPVVVGVEGHEDAGEVLRFAFEQAAARGTGVRVVHADTWEQPLPRFRDERIDEALAKVAAAHVREIEDLADAWGRRYPGVAVEVRQEREHPVTLLVRHARDGCLLVVGTRTRRSFAALRLGSVTRGVLHQATVVAVVPVGATASAGADPAGHGRVTPG